jgi:hypothetical protein
MALIGKPLFTEFGVHVEAQGFEDTERWLEGFEERVMTPLDNSIFDALESAEERRFDYLAPKFHRSGHLRASFTERHAPGAIRRAKGLTGDFGSSIAYSRAAAHQGGHYLLLIDAQGQREVAQAVMDNITGKGE